MGGGPRIPGGIPATNDQNTSIITIISTKGHLYTLFQFWSHMHNRVNRSIVTVNQLTKTVTKLLQNDGALC